MKWGANHREAIGLYEFEETISSLKIKYHGGRLSWSFNGDFGEAAVLFSLLCIYQLYTGRQKSIGRCIADESMNAQKKPRLWNEYHYGSAALISHFK